MSKESEVRVRLEESERLLRDMGEILLADIVGLVNETLAIKRKRQGNMDLPLPQVTTQIETTDDTQPLAGSQQ